MQFLPKKSPNKHPGFLTSREFFLAKNQQRFEKMKNRPHRRIETDRLDRRDQCKSALNVRERYHYMLNKPNFKAIKERDSSPFAKHSKKKVSYASMSKEMIYNELQLYIQKCRMLELKIEKEKLFHESDKKKDLRKSRSPRKRWTKDKVENHRLKKENFSLENELKKYRNEKENMRNLERRLEMRINESIELKRENETRMLSNFLLGLEIERLSKLLKESVPEAKGSGLKIPKLNLISPSFYGSSLHSDSRILGLKENSKGEILGSGGQFIIPFSFKSSLVMGGSHVHATTEREFQDKISVSDARTDPEELRKLLTKESFIIAKIDQICQTEKNFVKENSFEFDEKIFDKIDELFSKSGELDDLNFEINDLKAKGIQENFEKIKEKIIQGLDFCIGKLGVMTPNSRPKSLRELITMKKARNMAKPTPYDSQVAELKQEAEKQASNITYSEEKNSNIEEVLNKSNEELIINQKGLMGLNLNEKAYESSVIFEEEEENSIQKSLGNSELQDTAVKKINQIKGNGVETEVKKFQEDLHHNTPFLTGFDHSEVESEISENSNFDSIHQREQSHKNLNVKIPSISSSNLEQLMKPKKKNSRDTGSNLSGTVKRLSTFGNLESMRVEKRTSSEIEKNDETELIYKTQSSEAHGHNPSEFKSLDNHQDLVDINFHTDTTDKETSAQKSRKMKLEDEEEFEDHRNSASLYIREIGEGSVITDGYQSKEIMEEKKSLPPLPPVKKFQITPQDMRKKHHEEKETEEGMGLKTARSNSKESRRNLMINMGSIDKNVMSCDTMNMASVNSKGEKKKFMIGSNMTFYEAKIKAERPSIGGQSTMEGSLRGINLLVKTEPTDKTEDMSKCTEYEILTLKKSENFTEFERGKMTKGINLMENVASVSTHYKTGVKKDDEEMESKKNKENFKEETVKKKVVNIILHQPKPLSQNCESDLGESLVNHYQLSVKCKGSLVGKGAKRRRSGWKKRKKRQNEE